MNKSDMRGYRKFFRRGGGVSDDYFSFPGGGRGIFLVIYNVILRNLTFAVGGGGPG